MSMRMRQCTLCDLPARVYCESDNAGLCWDCDAKVHGANFLVARHSRSLLCRSCTLLTVWKASGPRLGPTVSVCDRCSRGFKVEDVRDDDGDVDVLEGNSDEGGTEEDVENHEEEYDENQVVPWGMEATTMEMTPPVASCSSSSTDDSDSSTCRMGMGMGNGDATRNNFAKRRREYLDLNTSPQDNLPSKNCSAPNFFHSQRQCQPPRHVEATFVGNLVPFGLPRKGKGFFFIHLSLD